MAGDSRINDLLSHWEAARSQGREITVEQLCAGCPELIGELKREIESRNQSRDKTKTIGEDSGATQEYSSSATQRELPEDAGLSVEMRFERLRLHGRGGLGEVYVAIDEHLNREVAVKFLKRSHAENPDSREQFVREGEITGRLEHPGVVAVHGIGTGPNRQPFYVMRFIDGESFEKAISRFHQPGQAERPASSIAISQAMQFRNLLSRFASVCNTIAYAHNRGVIHRDIKPDNIMLGRFGETLVVDWGLAMPVDRTPQARASGEKTLMPGSGSQSGSSSGGGAGTPAYMSPEQAGGSQQLGTASDIYSLGVTLYKILTGETPFKGDGPREIMEQVKQGRFPSPRAVKKSAPAALEAICLKAMAMRPADRYATALELAEEIEHWLGDEPVRAYREKPVQRLARWTRRHRGLAISGAVGVVAVVLITSVAAVLLGRTAVQERQAREQAILLSAKFAADAIASEIDLRLRTLETEATDPELLKHMDEVNAKPDDGSVREQLANWVNRRFINHNKNKPTRAGSWWVTNRAGRIVALQSEKYIEPEKYLKESFTERAWFHGGERDLPKEEVRSKGIGPTKHATVVAFHSKADNQLKVAFSVPVRSREDAPVLGVLSMAVRLGEFTVFQKELSPGKQVVLVSLNSDWIDNEERHGLVLHHPDQAASEATGSQPRPLRVTPETVEVLLEFRKRGIRRANASSSSGKSEGRQTHLFLPKYLNGAGDASSGSWLAAAEPVIVESRPNREGEKIRDCGWAVIVQERR